MSTGLRFTLEVDGLPPDAFAAWQSTPPPKAKMGMQEVTAELRPLRQDPRLYFIENKNMLFFRA